MTKGGVDHAWRDYVFYRAKSRDEPGNLLRLKSFFNRKGRKSSR